jgi:hypothetical protein
LAGGQLDLLTGQTIEGLIAFFELFIEAFARTKAEVP